MQHIIFFYLIINFLYNGTLCSTKVHRIIRTLFGKIAIFAAYRGQTDSAGTLTIKKNLFPKSFQFLKSVAVAQHFKNWHDLENKNVFWLKFHHPLFGLQARQKTTILQSVVRTLLYTTVHYTPPNYSYLILISKTKCLFTQHLFVQIYKVVHMYYVCTIYSTYKIYKVV